MNKGPFRIASIVLAALSLLFISVSPVDADNFAYVKPSVQPLRANNKYHWFAYASGVSSDVVAGFEATRTQSYEGTTLVTSYHGTGVADSTNWDVYVEECVSCLPAGVAGATQCNWSTSTSTQWYCNHSHIIISDTIADSFVTNNTPNYMQELACHETGHTVGLLHGTYDQTDPDDWACMRTGPFTTSNDAGTLDHRWLRSHNEGHINNAY